LPSALLGALRRAGEVEVKSLLLGEAEVIAELVEDDAAGRTDTQRVLPENVAPSFPLSEGRDVRG